MMKTLLKEYIAQVVEAIRSKKDPVVKWGKSGKFDLERFKSLPNEAIMQAYAMNYLEALGQGSSRIVFVLTSRKVLKLARNPKGVAQNSAELQVYTDPATADMAANIYDADEDGKWLVSDLVKPLTDPAEFKKLTGVDWQEFTEDLVSTVSAFARKTGLELRKSAPEFTKKVHRMAEKGSNKLKLGDLTVLDHWGKTPDGRVVILDYGFTEDVAKQHYSKSQPASKTNAVRDQKTAAKATAPEDKPTGR